MTFIAYLTAFIDTETHMEPSGKGRGRPVGKNPHRPYVPNGRPRGRPASDNPKPAYVPTGKPIGRQLGSTKRLNNRGAHFRIPDHLKVPKEVVEYVPTGNPRGRPNEGKTEKYVPTGRPRGRPSKETWNGIKT